MRRKSRNTNTILNDEVLLCDKLHKLFIRLVNTHEKKVFPLRHVGLYCELAITTRRKSRSDVLIALLEMTKKSRNTIQYLMRKRSVFD